MGQVSRDGVKEETLGKRGAARYVWPNLSVVSLAMELMTNAIQVGIFPTMMRALTLLLGYGWVGELLVNCLDRPLDPVGPALVCPLAWDEGGPLLGYGPEEGLNTVLGKACILTVAYYEHHSLEIIQGLVNIP